MVNTMFKTVVTKFENVIVTNHLSSICASNDYKLDQYFADQLKRFLDEHTLDNIIMLK